MHLIITIAMVLLPLVLLTGCEKMISKAGSEVFKISLREKCGEEEVACQAAVDNLFDKCQRKYEKEWKTYLDADNSKEDEPLRDYSEKMYGCIVDENGNPYFQFNPK